MHESLKSYLQNNFKISVDEINKIVVHFNPLNKDAGSYFLKKDETANCFAYIIKGVVRTNFIDDDGSDKPLTFLVKINL